MRADDHLPLVPLPLPLPVAGLQPRRRVLVGRRERGDWRCAVSLQTCGRPTAHLLPTTTLGDLLAIPPDPVAVATLPAAQRRRNA